MILILRARNYRANARFVFHSPSYPSLPLPRVYSLLCNDNIVRLGGNSFAILLSFIYLIIYLFFPFFLDFLPLSTSRVIMTRSRKTNPRSSIPYLTILILIQHYPFFLWSVYSTVQNFDTILTRFSLVSRKRLLCFFYISRLYISSKFRDRFDSKVDK